MCATNASWSAPAPAEIVHRRAGGRRRYNAQRQLAAMIRRMKVGDMVLSEKAAVVVPGVNGSLSSIRRALKAIRNRGMQARIARELGVSPATVCRDMKRLRRELRALTAPDPMSQVRELLAEAFRQDAPAPGYDCGAASTID